MNQQILHSISGFVHTKIIKILKEVEADHSAKDVCRTYGSIVIYYASFVVDRQ